MPPQHQPNHRDTNRYKTQTIDLLRHGETPLSGSFCGHTDPPITPNGLLQMQQTVATFAQSPYDLVLTSPLQRCAKFAGEYSQQNSIPLHYDERVMEYHFGDWEGIYPATIANTAPDQLQQFWHNPAQYSPPNGETYQHLVERIQQFLHATTQLQAEKILVVTHAGIIRTLIATILAIPGDKMLQLGIAPASLSQIQIYSSNNAPPTYQITAVGLFHRSDSVTTATTLECSQSDK